MIVDADRWGSGLRSLVEGFTVVTPQVQTVSPSRAALSDQSHTTAYERVLAAGLGAAVAAVAALALLVPAVPATAGDPTVATQAVAHGKATPRTGTAPSMLESDSSSAE